jgi:DHA3 family macrolide efflux protein-like MFS transporter
MGIGLIVGSSILSIWGGFKKKVYTSALGLMVGTIGLLMMSFAPHHMYWLLLVGIFIFGSTNAIVNGPLFAIFQESVDPKMQGRVFSLIGTMAMAVSPLGLLIAGPVSEWLGVQAWFLIGTIYIIFMCSVMVLSPTIRNLEHGNPNRTTPANLEPIPVEIES